MKRRDKQCVAKQTFTDSRALTLHTVPSKEMLKAVHFLVAEKKAGRGQLTETTWTYTHGDSTAAMNNLQAQITLM